MAKTRLTFCSQTSCDWAVYMLSAYRQFAGTIFVSPERHRKSLWASLRAADTDLAASGLYTQPVLPPIGQPYVLTAYSVYYVHKLDVQGGTRHLPPFPDTCPCNQPALAQTYATVVFGEGRVSGEQMLTVGRGLRTTATAAVGPS